MPALPQLDAEEQRILGVLLEKQVTVPASYPMSLSAVRTGCNQSSSRDPIVDYDEPSVEATLRGLKDRQLVRIVWADKGRRTLKYHQLLSEVLALNDAEKSLVTVLLLRGAQAPGELRTRTDRLHGFAERADVEAVLADLAARPEPLVKELPRQRGQHDNRWVHLLGDVPITESVVAESAPAVDRESVLAAGAEARDQRVRSSYDAVATAYADHLVDELAAAAVRDLAPDRVAAHADGGPVVEVGSGPGHVTAYLAEAGADASGIDLSPGMVAEARRRFPEGTYEVGDLRRLMRPTYGAGWAAVLAWYSLIHLAASELPDARGRADPAACCPGAGWSLGLHAGSEVRHLASWFDVPVDLDFVLHDPSEVVALVEAAGLTDVEWYLRGPLVSRGETTQRLYVVGRKPA